MTKHTSRDELANLLSAYLARRGPFIARAIGADFRHFTPTGAQPAPRRNGRAAIASLGETRPHLTDGPVRASHSNGHANGRDTNGHSTNGHSTNGSASNGSAPVEVKPAPAPAEPVELAIETVLVELIVRQTGYPATSITPDARLLDDLNLDSIKAGEVVAAAAKQAGVGGDLDPTTLANATLADVAAAIRALQPAAVAAPAAPVAEGPDAIAVLMALIEDRTGYPQSSLDGELRLLDDLNLDSIKAADLVATAAKQLGTGDNLDPTTLANATVAEVAAALQPAPVATPSAAPAAPTPQAPTPALPPTWVREFGVQWVPEDATPTLPAWAGDRVLLVADEDCAVAAAIAAQLRDLGARVERAVVAPTTGEWDHYLAVLPTIAEASELPLPAMVARVSGIALLASADASVGYVQFGGGDCGSGDLGDRPLPQTCNAAGFARSFHLERPRSSVRVVDLAEALPAERAATLVLDELGGDANIATVGYCADGVRRVLRTDLLQPAEYVDRHLDWSAADTILVTGGAKGITAECAFELARALGVKMALVGRSPAPAPGDTDNAISQTLARFAAADLECQYYSCDIADRMAVADLVVRVQTDLGPVTGIVHGAGLNTPRRVEQVAPEAAIAEAAPKLLGAYNLLDALSDAPPKLFAAFSSIIGVTGMPGNAWYAFANESLLLLLKHFEQRYAPMQTVALAYSVWGEVGMGARMGSVKNLSRMGIDAIPTDQGVSRFCRLFQRDPGMTQVVISARLGGLDTWTPTPLPAASDLRFIDRILAVEPQVELTVRTRLTLERDPYVGDHVWRGSYLFPTVFGLEAMAQAIAYVTGEPEPPIVRFENVSLRRPIVVAAEGGTEIEVHLELSERDERGERSARVGIRCEQTGFGTDHFAATVVLADAVPAGAQQPVAAGEPLPLDPQTDLYGGLLFQGDRFQRMGEIYTMTSKVASFRAELLPDAELGQLSFAMPAGRLVLGDPYFRDVMLQSVQLTVPQHICLPVEIERIDCFARAEGAERWVTVDLQAREDREYRSAVVATAADGTAVEQLSGYRLRILEEYPDSPTAEELAAPQDRDARCLQAALSQASRDLNCTVPAFALGFAPHLQSLSRPERREREEPLVAAALSAYLGRDADSALDVAIAALPSGKPQLTGADAEGCEVSLSHCDRYCLCAVGPLPQGCDIEAVTPRSAEDWVALLGKERQATLERAMAGGDNRDRAGTRIWSALEAVRKACNGSAPTFAVGARAGDAVLLDAETESGSYQVLTVPVALSRPPERMVAIVLDREPVAIAAPATAAAAPQLTFAPTGPQGQPACEKQFAVGLRESASLSQRVYFTQYFNWVGKMRELPLSDIAAAMRADLMAGAWALVTKTVSLRILGEATAYDRILARCWLGTVDGSQFTTYVEFCKQLPHGQERLAIAEVKAGWVARQGQPEPFPVYFADYLQRFSGVPTAVDLRAAELPLPPLLPTGVTDLTPGAIVARFDQRPGEFLHAETFATTLEESNLAGNVYYSHYFVWQGRVLELYLHERAPELFRPGQTDGELLCRYCDVDYLREAQPFDRVRVRLYVESVNACGATLNFEFWRDRPDGSPQKLQVGRQEVLWVTRDAAGRPVAAPLPAAIAGAFAVDAAAVLS